MNVVFLPYMSGNPYQDELAGALERRGVSVALEDHNPLFPLLGAMVKHDFPDVIHIHWAHPLLVSRWRIVSALLAVRLLFELLVVKLFGTRLVWTVHNQFHHDRPSPYVERFGRSCLSRLCDSMIVHAPAARAEVIDAYGLPAHHASAIHAIPHGNYIDTYENEVSQGAARSALDLDTDGPVYLFFGNIRPYKNVPSLIEAFKGIDDPDARLLIAGQPPDAEADRRRLRERCESDERIRTFFEFVDPEEIQLYMNAADVVVLPFNQVLTSGSVVLAMSFGRPVIAPRRGCIPDTVGAHDDLLYDPSEPDGLATAMRRARSENLDATGRALFRRARTFDWETITAQTAAVYRDRTVPAADDLDWRGTNAD